MLRVSRKEQSYVFRSPLIMILGCWSKITIRLGVIQLYKQSKSNSAAFRVSNSLVRYLSLIQSNLHSRQDDRPIIQKNTSVKAHMVPMVHIIVVQKINMNMETRRGILRLQYSPRAPVENSKRHKHVAVREKALARPPTGPPSQSETPTI